MEEKYGMNVNLYVSLYYTSTLMVEWNPFPDMRNVAVSDSDKIVDIFSVASDSEV